ncbi:MAG: ATP-binding cassette domain-containing protein, partial [Proteobacteria bacterium]|nr:ATP-binding cassette domain-containing protein [Pseudomonadota bacterium]
MAQAKDFKEGETILKLQNVHMYFGRVAALAGVDLEIKKGEIHSIIGPNGAGKTVMMNCINGLYRPQRGDIYFKDQKINDLRPYERAKLGISRTFQKIELFGGMTVLDNIRLGRHIHLKSGIMSGAVYAGKTKQEEIATRKFIEEEIIDLLEIE